MGITEHHLIFNMPENQSTLEQQNLPRLATTFSAVVVRVVAANWCGVEVRLAGGSVGVAWRDGWSVGRGGVERRLVGRGGVESRLVGREAWRDGWSVGVA